MENYTYYSIICHRSLKQGLVAAIALEHILNQVEFALNKKRTRKAEVPLVNPTLSFAVSSE